ncbi:ABC transporter permease subunit [Enterobacillus tribolii]|uniref:Phosphate transport system permease protein n=1 Tax=Enterobacillus tribolii TaxID=1487935 RepID=A0A370QRZ0_9GAMM|nr:ABC transporter permease subunit [Enterobacillus tribolii]MBW7983471.1 ABC transporter permease subunit [Enterobacillus tribolii]RDK92034.1 phosphate transport system permease protein [Enterobacillus tribolii]
MGLTPSQTTPLGRRRARRDRLTRYAISAGGVWVLLTLMLIFFYLIYTVWPLFRPASIGAAQPLAWQAHSPTLTAGVEHSGQWAWRVDQSGTGTFFSLKTGGESGTSGPLMPSPPTAFARLDGNNTLLALGDGEGRIRLVTPRFRTPGDAPAPQWGDDYGTAPQLFDPRRQPLTQLGIARRGNDVMAAALTADGRVLMGTWRPKGWQVNVLEAREPVSQLLLAPDAGRLFLLGKTHLSVFAPDNGSAEPREDIALDARRMLLLPGASSLLLLGGDGVVSQWFEVNRRDETHLTRIRDYSAQKTIALMTAEPYRRVFATLARGGALSLYDELQTSPLLTYKLPADTRGIWFASAGDGLLTENARGMVWYPLDNAYPGINWRTLLLPVWFENYPAPDYVWQSTSGADDYQAKYSLWPVVAGTLKAALYALAFAAPLAVAGAVYTACFMSAGLRRVVKPAIEMTGALPTVVIGLVAAIWLAPVIEAHLLALLLLPLALPLVTLGGGALCARWLKPARQRAGAGREILFLLPLVAVTVAALFAVAPWLERLIWDMPLHEFLGDRYEQRNALVVAVALGFALVPVIFTLAEDALFGVPPALTQGSLALGATPWQTVWHVVLPGASAGIFSALMIGLGRAVGETMIVLMATGNTPLLDASPFQGLRALAANIAIEMPEAVAGSAHYRILFLTALVLFVFTFVVNTLAEAVRLRLRARYDTQREGL